MAVGKGKEAAVDGGGLLGLGMWEDMFAKKVFGRTERSFDQL